MAKHINSNKLSIVKPTKEESNMIMCLLQQKKWLIACSMGHQVKHKTRRKAAKINQNMVTEVLRRRGYFHQLRQFKYLQHGQTGYLKCKKKNADFLTVSTSIKLNRKYLVVLSTSLTIT